MIPFLGILVGFVTTFLSQTLLATISYFALAALYALGLFLHFYAKRTIWHWPFYLGITIGAELLGSNRFGLYTLFTYATFILIILFKERLRFTSLSLRFTIALGINLVAYGLIANELTFAWRDWLSLLTIFIVFSGLAILRPSLTSEPPYESI
jgi:hypothetical protein